MANLPCGESSGNLFRVYKMFAYSVIFHMGFYILIWGFPRNPSGSIGVASSVPLKVRNLRKIVNFGQNFSIFAHCYNDSNTNQLKVLTGKFF